MHERLFHLFVVSRDLRYFAHVHPTLGANTAFDIDLTLPRPGHYQLIADLVASDGASRPPADDINTGTADIPVVAGTIDEVRVYNRALTATEIQTDMAAAITAKPTP